MKKELLYLKIADAVEHQIKNNVLKVGDKLPSIRTICKERGVSVSTATQAYLELDKRGLVEVKNKSGYYVSYAHQHFKKLASVSQPKMVKNANNMEDVMRMIVENFGKSKIQLSSAHLSPDLVPIKKINSALLLATKTLADSGVTYNTEGSIKLKKNIAKRALSWGGKLNYEDVITTAGCTDAYAFCLMALTQRGDTIAVESPTYFGFLRLAHQLGLNVIELPTHPVDGVDIDSLKKLMKSKKIKLCLLTTNYSNPMGGCMTSESKRELVKVAEKYNVPIVEDDVYGELSFSIQRPDTCKTYDDSGIVLYCNSFSKTLVSGYRVGWLLPGKFKAEVARVKHYRTMYNSIITHEAIGNFMEIGRYDLHIRKLRTEIYNNYLNLQRAISLYFPDDTKVAHPQGGLNLWIEFNKKFDAIGLYNKAILNKISITPGRIYTLQNQFNNCIRLCYGQKWDAERENALKLLGKLAKG